MPFLAHGTPNTKDTTAANNHTAVPRFHFAIALENGNESPALALNNSLLTDYSVHHYPPNAGGGMLLISGNWNGFIGNGMAAGPP